MSPLKTLKLTTANRNPPPDTRRGTARGKLANHLNRQQALAEAEIDGTPLQATR